MQALLKQADDLAINISAESLELHKTNSQGEMTMTLGVASFGRKNVDAQGDLGTELEVSADLGYFSFTESEFKRLKVETEDILIFRNEKYLVRKVYKTQTGNFMAVASEYQNSSRVGEDAQKQIYLFKIKASVGTLSPMLFVEGAFSDDELVSIIDNYNPIAIYDDQVTILKLDPEAVNLFASTQSDLENQIDDTVNANKSFEGRDGKTYHVYLYIGTETELRVIF